jgi:rRNA-processing protein FCF1
LELIGSDNPDKYMVCSQDLELRRELRQIGGVPTFFFSLDVKFDIEEPTRYI